MKLLFTALCYPWNWMIPSEIRRTQVYVSFPFSTFTVVLQFGSFLTIVCLCKTFAVSIYCKYCRATFRCFGGSGNSELYKCVSINHTMLEEGENKMRKAEHPQMKANWQKVFSLICTRKLHDNPRKSFYASTFSVSTSCRKFKVIWFLLTVGCCGRR